MTGRLQRPSARFASAAKCWAPITRRRCKRSKASPASDPPPLEQGQGAGGDDARAALGREGSGKEAERACDLATAVELPSPCMWDVYTGQHMSSIPNMDLVAQKKIEMMDAVTSAQEERPFERVVA